ncbi:zinc-dependent metalloprotease [Altererythrobacter arenosus]|uniref:Zinc-dependent metalloprotease n=1 Tax=Altererythrobacter arenosus TaxID=3032592 RepID=A0ABY8FYC2_9SPHN|nr:zinc-dependent metalloprotease [Altererythrobacter sp. CAU 1644]WFL76999.1 zinc-dependent metalloprotease [Altererythrobacter sp. CAU 1644]
MRSVLLAGAVALAVALSVPAVAEDALIEVAASQEDGKIMLTLPAAGPDGIMARYLYVAQIETGVGSAATGVDRGAPLRTGIIRFRRMGKKVLAELENTTFIAPAGSAAQQASVANSFTNATLWVGDIEQSAGGKGVSFDFAPFLAMDHFGFAPQLGEGYALNEKFSLADPAKVKAFPENVEFSALLSFSSKKPTPELRNVSPSGGDVSLWVRHSLIALPDEPIAPRADPYNFAFSTYKYDFSAPLGRSMLVKLAERHRLEKVDPAAERSPVKEPIVYYVDGAAPEPVRQALIDGVGWWAEAFEDAGFIDAFRVDVLPPEIDPLDIRYNVVNWVNRATRGWSYGPSIVDPRTGEILKGSVMLGSLRVRQDILIFQALMGAGLTDSGLPDDPVAVALARIRQLGAHEVGHTLGLAHNFAASSQGRYSVMDYPAPRIELVDGKLTIADAYGVGVGEWDKFAIKYLYAARSDAEARAMVQEAQARGLRFVGDSDARGSDSANPHGSLWDDFADPVAELGRVMAVRQAALARFDANAVPEGQDLASLRRAFVPIWLLHRYQVESAAKALGGVVAPHALAGDQAAVEKVAGTDQRAALDALISAMSVEALEVPARLQPLLSYGPSTDYDYSTMIEVMPTAGGPVFDTLRATEIGAVHVLDSLLDPQRLNRLEMQSSGDAGTPSAHAVVTRLVEHADASARRGATGRRIATVIALDLARTAREGQLSRSIALQIDGQLARWADDLGKASGTGEEADWRRGLGALLSDSEKLSEAVKDKKLLPDVPPGMPI